MADGENSKFNGLKTPLIAVFAILALAAAMMLLPPLRRSHHHIQLLTSNRIAALATYTLGTNQPLYFYKGVPMANQSVGNFLFWLNSKTPRHFFGPFFSDLSVFHGIVNNSKPALFVYVWRRDRVTPPPFLVVSVVSPSGQIILAKYPPSYPPPLDASKVYLFDELPDDITGFLIQIADGPQPLASIKLEQ